MAVPAFVKSITGVTALILVVLLVVAGMVFQPVKLLTWLAAGAVAVVGIVNTVNPRA